MEHLERCPHQPQPLKCARNKCHGGRLPPGLPAFGTMARASHTVRHNLLARFKRRSEPTHGQATRLTIAAFQARKQNF
eukprot:6485960-Amphidinium_carterae.1